MRFVDEARIHVESGAGGNGCIAFRRERYVAFGGPNGGSGGAGGDVVLVATTSRNSLLELRGKAIWRAKRGEHGRGSSQTGKRAKPLEIALPVGTRVFDVSNGDEDAPILVDLTEDGQRFVVAPGGRGGLGNEVFKSSTNQAPRKQTDGAPGVELRLRLELLLMADVGLLGFPNAGKSTFVSRVSAARPKIAGYPFTTLVPSLGMVDMGFEGSFVVADIPGLIEGAAEGAGLGHQFLRHVRRTRVLLHLVSLGPDEVRPPGERYSAIRGELLRFDAELAKRPELVVLTKSDLGDAEAIDSAREALLAAGAAEVLVASAVTGEGIRTVVGKAWVLVQEGRAQ